ECDIISSLRVRVSLDTVQRLPYNLNAPRKLKKDNNTLTQKPAPKTPPTVTLTASNTSTKQYISNLLKRDRPSSKQGVLQNYLGYDLWLPSPSKLEKPRSVYNTASLAYLGDCIYEVGYLYLTNTSRLEVVMLKLGFSIDSSEHLNLEEGK
ncbi:Ribonuclease III family protein, partial [Quillaja saponaria]